MSSFKDGITNIINKLANRRSATATNRITSERLLAHELRAIYRTGVGSKIVRLKAGYALNETLQFKREPELEFYQAKLERSVKGAAKFMIGFGRGIILINERGQDHSKPATTFNLDRVKLDVFSGDMVNSQDVSRDLNDERYGKPRSYMVRGVTFHWTRVIDFTYFMPAEEDAPNYDYGGISEFELIYTQLINDALVERSSGTIIEKNSSLFHKVKGFKDAVRCGEDDALVEYYSKLADLRGIYGDGLIDSEDDVVTVAQSLSDLAAVNTITLQRLCMVTGLSMTALVGEEPKGLNTTGEGGRQVMQDTIEALQFDYLLEPIQRLCEVFGIDGVAFKDNQGGSATQRIEFETKAIDNALKLDALGEDYRGYLIEHAVVTVDNFDLMFSVDEI
jgi:hypothetical protein